MSISGSINLVQLRMIRDPGEMDPSKIALILGPEFPDSLRDEILAKFFKRGSEVELFSASDPCVVRADNNFQETVMRIGQAERLPAEKPFHVLDESTAVQFDFIYHMNHFLHQGGEGSVTFCAWPAAENAEMHRRVL